MTADRLDPDLLRLLRQLASTTPVVTTISSRRPNRISGVGPDGVWIETERSDEKGAGPQHVPAWMIQIAWDHLRREGELTNAYLLAADGLNVKRSSAVCALLAGLPGVSVASSRPIRLRFSDTHLPITPDRSDS